MFVRSHVLHFTRVLTFNFARKKRRNNTLSSIDTTETPATTTMQTGCTLALESVFLSQACSSGSSSMTETIWSEKLSGGNKIALTWPPLIHLSVHPSQVSSTFCNTKRKPGHVHMREVSARMNGQVQLNHAGLVCMYVPSTGLPWFPWAHTRHAWQLQRTRLLAELARGNW